MLKKSASFWLAMFVAAALLSLALACGGGKETDNAGGGGTDKPAGPKYSGAVGSVSGKVAFNGTAPAPKKIDSSADPVCGQKSPNLSTEDTVVTDGKLANAFVYIKDGTTADGKKIGDFTWDTPAAAAVLDQNGCHYKPHVMGVMTNQKISITNSDPTTHNIHPQPAVNQEWNQSQVANAAPLEKSFNRQEILVPVKCNQHPWMKAYIGVLKHPFFAVSNADGSFEIKGVPAGKYTLAAWHEGGVKGTEKTMEVTVTANGSATADFTFDAAATAQNSREGSMEMMPAMELPMLVKH
ncbi:MAG: carboxypeptidase regulatory-like domain-containing protein [Pyrinomonadaceae bacterium]